MHTFLAASILALVLPVVTEPVRYGLRDDEPTSAPPATVTVTVTAGPPPDVVITRTITRSAWTTTTTAVVNLNCTQQVYAPRPTPSSTALPPSSTGERITERQESTSTGKSPTSAPSPTPVPLPTQRTRTRTSYVYTTAMQTEPLTRTRYQCAATIAYAFTVDATTTVSYTQTQYQSIGVLTSTVICPGVGGFPFGYTVPTIPASVPPSVPPTIPTPIEPASIAKRQTTPPPEPSTTAPAVTSLANLGTLTTVTVHQTQTAYTLVTLSVTDVSTNVRYACSTLPFDVTVTYPVTRTSWPSTTTVVSYLNCGRSPVPVAPPVPPRPTDATTQAERLKRQTSEPPPAGSTAESTPSQAQTIHRTSYVASVVTIVASTDATRLVYSCSPTPTTPVSVSPSLTSAESA